MNMPMFTAGLSLSPATNGFRLDGTAHFGSDRITVNPQQFEWAGCLCTRLCVEYPSLYCCGWLCCVCRGGICNCT